MKAKPRYKDIHQMKREVSVQDKVLIAEGDAEASIAMLVEKYNTTRPAAVAYVDYLAGGSGAGQEGGAPAAEAPGGPAEEIMRLRQDEKTGEWVRTIQDPKTGKEY